MTAISLASALAQKGYKVALADADNQKSTLQWLKHRPAQAAQIQSLDWRNSKSIGDAPKQIEYLIIDAPGALTDDHAEQLISEAHAIIIPIQPSFLISIRPAVFSNICRTLNASVRARLKFYFWPTEPNRMPPAIKTYSSFLTRSTSSQWPGFRNVPLIADWLWKACQSLINLRKSTGNCRLNGNRY